MAPRSGRKKTKRSSSSRSSGSGSVRTRTPSPAITYSKKRDRQTAIATHAALSLSGSSSISIRRPVANAYTASSSSTCTTSSELPLILTSAKRRGLFECDYCRTDLSQVPRICCAICPDFDLCLECFTKSYEEKEKQKEHGDGNGNYGRMEHDASHGYRVCDSTRYFLFPSLRGVTSVTVTGELPHDNQSNNGSGSGSLDGNGNGNDGVVGGGSGEGKVKDIVDDGTKNVVLKLLEEEKEKEVPVNVDMNMDMDVELEKVDVKESKGTEMELTTGTDQDTAMNMAEEEDPNLKQKTGEDRDKNDDDNEDHEKEKEKDEDHHKDKDMDADGNTDRDEEATETEHSQSNSNAPDSDGESPSSSHDHPSSANVINEADVPQDEDTDAGSGTGSGSGSGAGTTDMDMGMNMDTASQPSTKRVNEDGNENETSKIEEAGADNGDHNDGSTSISSPVPDNDNADAATEPQTDTVPESEVVAEDEESSNDVNHVTGTDTQGEESDTVLQDSGINRNKTAEEKGTTVSNATIPSEYKVTDDVRNMWTVEEDLRLLDAILTVGLGNWVDIAEEVAGTSGNSNKNAKKCMERYLYDYLGTYGEILPSFTLVEVDENGEDVATVDNDVNGYSDGDGYGEGDSGVSTGVDGNGDGAVEGDGLNGDGQGQNPDMISSVTDTGLGGSVSTSGNDTAAAAATATTKTTSNHGDRTTNSRKRMRSEISFGRQTSMTAMTSASAASTTNTTSTSSTFVSHTTNKKYRVVPTSTLPLYQHVWPDPYLPPIDDVQIGDDVGRDLAVKAEQAFVKASAATSSATEARALRDEWEMHRLNQHGGPTVLPPRPEDVKNMQGSDLAGFMPRRGDFDIEWDNDAEKLIMDMEFTPDDTPEDRELKVRVLQIYNDRLDEREKRKQFLIDRNLLDYRKKYQEDLKLPPDERDFVNRMRLFARFHSAEEHDRLIENLLKAKRLRKEIARLQMYRRMGFTSLIDAERFELDRNRREAHRVACEQRERDEKKANASGNSAGAEADHSGQGALENNNLMASHVEAGIVGSSSYSKQYNQNDRNNKRKLGDAPSDATSTATGTMDTDAKSGSPNDKSRAVGQNDGSTDVKRQGSGDARGKKEEAFNVRNHEGYELLSKKELDLCQNIELQPKLYMEAKKAIIHEALVRDLLDHEETGRRTTHKIDIEKRGDVYDFCLQAGFIPSLPDPHHHAAN